MLQEAFLQVYRAVRNQLGTIMGFLFISSQSQAADGSVTPEDLGLDKLLVSIHTVSAETTVRCPGALTNQACLIPA